MEMPFSLTWWTMAPNFIYSCWLFHCVLQGPFPKTKPFSRHPRKWVFCLLQNFMRCMSHQKQFQLHKHKIEPWENLIWVKSTVLPDCSCSWEYSMFTKNWIKELKWRTQEKLGSNRSKPAITQGCRDSCHISWAPYSCFNHSFCLSP